MPSKGNTTARGYGAKHQKLRDQYEPLVASGKALCRRCGQPITSGAKWDLGHDDDDRTLPAQPEHIGKECPMGGNRATAGRQGQQVMAPPVDTSRAW